MKAYGFSKIETGIVTYTVVYGQTKNPFASAGISLAATAGIDSANKEQAEKEKLETLKKDEKNK